MDHAHGIPAKHDRAATVLVMDDESNVRALLSRWLMEAGYATLEARDGEEALARLAQMDVQLVTLDIRMPGQSGLDLVYRIKHDYPNTAILMVTGVNVAADAISALTRGAAGYIIKPVDREDFLFQVRTALAERLHRLQQTEQLVDLQKQLKGNRGLVKRSPPPSSSRKQTRRSHLAEKASEVVL